MTAFANLQLSSTLGSSWCFITCAVLFHAAMQANFSSAYRLSTLSCLLFLYCHKGVFELLRIIRKIEKLYLCIFLFCKTIIVQPIVLEVG